MPDDHLPGPFDVAVVGAGICGLAHALAAARLGKRVVVVDRDAHANGASIRNFGFITVTGQQAGECWRRAMRSRDVWLEVAEAAGIADPAARPARRRRRPEAQAVLEEFMATEMGAECRLLEPARDRRAMAMACAARTLPRRCTVRTRSASSRARPSRSSRRFLPSVTA